MKYDSQLVTVKSLLPTAQNILIALPTNSDIDKLAAALALFLSLEAAGKQVTIVCDDTIRVGQAHLFGIDHVKNTLPPANAGNLVLTLEGVASVNGTIPALEKLDWYAENNNLNLVFHVLPGQTFQPVRITPKYQTSGFNLIFTIGAPNLAALGMVYQSNLQAFSGAHLINIDTQSINSNFGQSNVVDPVSATVCEVVSNIISDLGFVTDADTATNLLAGIFDATKNLTDSKVNADTYMVVGNLLKVGGKKPVVSTIPPANNFQSFQNIGGPQPDLSVLMPPEPKPVASQSATDFTIPPVVSNSSNNQPSPEERPAGEGVISETVEPDWLTPKIFKGTSLG